MQYSKGDEVLSLCCTLQTQMHYDMMIVVVAEADVFCLLYNIITISREYSFGSRIVFLGELSTWMYIM